MKLYIWEFLDEYKRFLAGSNSNSSGDRYSCKKVTGHCAFSSSLHINHWGAFLFFCLRDLAILDGFIMCVGDKEACFRPFLSLLSTSTALCPSYCCTLHIYLLEGRVLCLYFVPGFKITSLPFTVFSKQRTYCV